MIATEIDAALAMLGNLVPEKRGRARKEAEWIVEHVLEYSPAVERSPLPKDVIEKLTEVRNLAQQLARKLRNTGPDAKLALMGLWPTELRYQHQAALADWLFAYDCPTCRHRDAPLLERLVELADIAEGARAEVDAARRSKALRGGCSHSGNRPEAPARPSRCDARRRHRPLKQLTSTKSGPFLKFVDHLANAAGGAEPLSGLVDVAKEVLRKVREVIAAEVTFVEVRDREGEAAAKPARETCERLREISGASSRGENRSRKSDSSPGPIRPHA